MTEPRRSGALLGFCLACVSLAASPVGAQDPAAPATAAVPTPEALRLETVLGGGAALAPRAPAVLWRPGSHDATVVMTADDGSQTLHAWREGKLDEPPLASAAQLRKALGEPEQGPARFGNLAWLDQQTLRVERGNAVHRWTLGAERAEPVIAWPEGATAVAVAPGDAHVAAVIEGNLMLIARAADGSQTARQLSFDGGPDIVYGGAAHRAEFGIQSGLFWNDDGSRLAFYREDQWQIAPFPYHNLDTMPPQPRHGRYPMAGRTHGRVTVGVFDCASANTVYLAHDPDEDVYWTNVAFAPSGDVYVARVDRGQSRMELCAYDGLTGAKKATLLTESDPEWIEPEHPPTFLRDGRFLWWSSGDGYRHLYLHGPDGARIGQVTKGSFDVQALHRVGDDGKVWFSASGEDPRQLHLFVTALDGDETRQVTRERGTHEVALSPDGAAAVATWSNLETPPTLRLMALPTGDVQALPPVANPLLGYRLPTQRMFQVKADDGTILYGHLALPPDLQEGKKYPVLLYVYGGPHLQQVTDRWLGGAAPWLQAFANEGYIVARLDNRGTPNRGIEFEQKIFRNLGDLEVKDQLAAVQWLAQQPFVDADRIGVHGWSYGGYMTLRLLLKAPTTFACGISGAPVTDWAMYETGYGERYMDTPAENEAGYRAASCLPLVKDLQRPLLLALPSDDDTVVPSHGLAFLDAAIDAGKFVDAMVYPMQKHGLRGADRAHFVRYLKVYLDRHCRPQ